MPIFWTTRRVNSGFYPLADTPQSGHDVVILELSQVSIKWNSKVQIVSINLFKKKTTVLIDGNRWLILLDILVPKYCWQDNVTIRKIGSPLYFW